ncbi:hypothetical protein [Verrucosispora sp. NA02020]|uniref:hypothetical protein n=1 Tax=Verrucosispora sp. NA02020 TaxID=2742132 RepID=UPI001590E6ED|nr:hypothetical protein [Verrucosispora sp. NA02020]QKW13730.1 hypothetical protein HUT12_13685 [Verrucosispora sp. NA02020]
MAAPPPGSPLRAELGQATTALRQFRQVLTHVRAASPTALELRRNISMVLLSEGEAAEAVDELRPLHDDLCVVYAPQHDETQEVAEVLARLRLTH